MSRKIYPSILEKIVFLLYFFALCVPALVFSGRKFADFLYIVKWASFYAPFFALILVIGFNLLINKIQEFKFDVFALVLGLILFFCAAQYFFIRISSKPGFIQEILCFASAWLFYIFASEYFPNGSLNIFLWCANINAALNVGIAELQTRGLYKLEFLKGTAFEFLMPLKSLIYDGLMGPAVNYIGNIGMHNILGLWLAVCAVGALYLFFVNVQKRKIFSSICALFFVSVNTLGLLSSNSRSGLFSMLAGLLVMGILFIFRYGRKFIKYLVIIAVIFAIAVAGLIFSNSLGINRMLKKITTPEQYTTVAGRTGLWARSFDMIKLHPEGVGIGQYKWHFLEAQRERLKADPNDRFRYTFWAHNEYIQFFCEAGIIGGSVLILLLIFWFYKFFSLLKTQKEFSNPLIWSCGVVAVFLFHALWSRPFHMPDFLAWLMLAFAVGNREILSNRKFNFPKKLLKPLGLIFIIIPFLGSAYIGGGLYGNLILRKAYNTSSKLTQTKLALYTEAQKYPFVSERARRDIALFSLALSEKMKNKEVREKAFLLLLDCFFTEPNPNDLPKLMHLAEDFQREAIMRELISYYKPGMYEVKKIKLKDDNGKIFEKIKILDGPLIKNRKKK